MDEPYSKSEEICILLAYYYGRHKLLNSVALQRITKDLIQAFDQTPENRSTKYSKPLEACCLCQEKEDVFKDIFRRCFDSHTAVSTRRPNEKVVDKAWNDIVQLWENARTGPQNGVPDCETTEKRLLEDHNIAVVIEKIGDQALKENWTSTNKAVKEKLEACILAMEQINGNCVSSAELGPHFTKWSLRNAYLTFLTEKGARTHAKFMQDRRCTGIQIRAARDPISVIAKYMMCGSCFEPEKKHQCTMVMEVLAKCVKDVRDVPKLDAPPDNAAKFLDPQTIPAMKACNSWKQIVINNIMPAFSQDGTCKETTPRRSDRAHAGKKKESFVYYTNGGETFENDDSSNLTNISTVTPLKRRRASLPAIATSIVSETPSISVKQENRFNVPDNENFSVVIVTSTDNTPAPPGIAVPSSGTVCNGTNNIHAAAVPVSSDNYAVPVKRCKIVTKSSPQLLEAVKPQKVIFLPQGGSNSNMGAKTTIIPLKISPAVSNNSSVRNRSVSLDGARTQKVIFQTIKPSANSQNQSSDEKIQKKPFVVQIVNGTVNRGKAHSDSGLPNSNIQAPTIKKIPLSRSQVKFLKSVSLKNRFSLGKQQTEKTTPVCIKPATSATAHTVLFHKPINLNQSHIMRINPLPIANGSVLTPSQNLQLGKCFTFKTGALRLPESGQTGRAKAVFHSSIQPTGVLPKILPSGFSAFKKTNFHQVYSPTKTPGKKKPKPPSKSIPTVVAEYIFSLIPSADKELWKKVQLRNKRRGEKSSALIPIPYETNFLCIYDTIERHGWKAYWYRKCRCSKIREKLADAGNEDVERNPKNFKSWIPKTLPERTKNVLNSFLESEDKPGILTYDPSPPLKEKLSPASKQLFDLENCKNRVELPSASFKKLTPIPVFTVKSEFVAEEKSNCLNAQDAGASDSPVGKRRKLEDSERPRTATLKAKYRKDKNGNWTALKSEPDDGDRGQELKTIPNHAAQDNKYQDDGKSEDSVMLNFRTGINFPQKSSLSVKDCVGTTNDHGLRRCARATMIRRKALVQRALDAEMKSKVGREKSESNAAETLMFVSYHDESLAKPLFDVVSAHPLCFRDDPETFIRLSTTQENKSKTSHDICVNKNKELHDFRRQRRSSDEFYSILSKLPAQNLPSKSEKVTKKYKRFNAKESAHNTFKSSLVDELETMWTKNENLSVKLQNTPSAENAESTKHSFFVPDRRVISQLTPEHAVYNLQTLRGLSASDPPTCVISKESAKFIVSAVQTAKEVHLSAIKSKLKPAMGTQNNGKSSKKFATEKHKSFQQAEHSLKKGTFPSLKPQNCQAEISQNSLKLVGKNESGKPEPESYTKTPLPVISPTILTCDSIVKREPKRFVDGFVKTDSEESFDKKLSSKDSSSRNKTAKEKIDAPQREYKVTSSHASSEDVEGTPHAPTSDHCCASGQVQKENIQPHCTLNKIHSYAPPCVPSYVSIYKELKSMLNASKSSKVSIQSQNNCDEMVHAQLKRRLKRKKTLSSYLNPKFDVRRMGEFLQSSRTSQWGIFANGNRVGKGEEERKVRTSNAENCKTPETRSDHFSLKEKPAERCDASPELVRGSFFSKTFFSPKANDNFGELFSPDIKLPVKTPPDAEGQSKRCGEQVPVSSPASFARQKRKRRHEFTSHALDGMYWSNLLDNEPRDATDSGINLRRRRIETLETTPSTVTVNKRKRTGHGYLSSASSHTSELLEADRSSLEKCSFTKQVAEAEDPLHHLMSQSLNVERVRTWMWDSTSAKSFRLRTSWETVRPKRWKPAKRRYSAGSPQTRDRSPDDSGSETAKSGREKQYFSDGDERQGRSFLPGPLKVTPSSLKRAYVPLVPCCVATENNSTGTSSKQEETSPGTKLFLLKHCTQESPRPRGLSKSRRTGHGRRLDFSEILPADVIVDAADDPLSPKSSKDGDTISRRVRSCRLKRPKRGNRESEAESNREGQKDKKMDIQALRETVFAELQENRSFQGKTKPESRQEKAKKERRRPLLQSRCSTKGSFISRLLECDTLSTDLVHS